MAQRPIGVEDVAAGAGVAEFRTRERTVSAQTVVEQYLVPERERVVSSAQQYSHQANVAAAADGASAFRWMVLNPAGSPVTVGLKMLELYAFLATVIPAASALSSSPRFTLETFTATGTPAGGTRIIPARVGRDILLGRVTAGASLDFSTAGNTAAWPFVAVRSGDLKYIYAQTKQANTAAAVRMGIYADDGAGLPGALLGVASVDSLAEANSTNIHRATLASTVPIVAGTTYHLGWFAQTDNRQFLGDVGGSYEEDATANFADPFVSSGNSSINAAIWGEEATEVAQVYSAAPTGLTLTKVADAFAFLPAFLLNNATGVGNPFANWAVSEDYQAPGDISLELAAGEALLFRQADAGSTSETTQRGVTTNFLVEEFTLP